MAARRDCAREDLLRRRRDQLEDDRLHLEARLQERDERNALRIHEAKATFAQTLDRSKAIISGCFEVEDQRAVLYKIFADRERASFRAGRVGVEADDLSDILQQLTGCRPQPDECRRMMTSHATIDFDQFLSIYKGVTSGDCQFQAFAQTLHDFRALCNLVPDSPHRPRRGATLG